MKTLILTLFALGTCLSALTAEARVYREGGYWHGHPRGWWVNHHYRWSGGEWVLIPGYEVPPVYEYGYRPYRWHRYHRWYGHRDWY